MNNHKIRRVEKNNNFGITVFNPLIETKADHYTKKLRLATGEGSTGGGIVDYNMSLYPSEWSRI